MILGHSPAQLQQGHAGPAKENLMVQVHHPADRADELAIARAQTQRSGNREPVPDPEERDPCGVSRASLLVKMEFEGNAGLREALSRHARQRQDRLGLDLETRAREEGKDVTPEGTEKDLGEIAQIVDRASTGARPGALACSPGGGGMIGSGIRWLLPELERSCRFPFVGPRS